MEAKTDPYFFSYFTVEGTNRGLNTNGNDPYGYVINTWMTADAGNQYYLIEAADFDATEALAVLADFFIPDGINTLSADSKAEIFDLTGRKTNKLQRVGIYIINRKRVLVK